MSKQKVGGGSPVLEATIAKAVAAGVLKGEVTAIIDSSPVTGAGAVADTSELVRKTMGRGPDGWRGC